MKCRSRSLWKGTGVAVVLLQAQWRALDCTTRPVGEINSFDSSLPLGYADMAVLLTSQVDEATMAPMMVMVLFAGLNFAPRVIAVIKEMAQCIDETAGSSIDLSPIRTML